MVRGMGYGASVTCQTLLGRVDQALQEVLQPKIGYNKVTSRFVDVCLLTCKRSDFSAFELGMEADPPGKSH